MKGGPIGAEAFGLGTPFGRDLGQVVVDADAGEVGAGQEITDAPQLQTAGQGGLLSSFWTIKSLRAIAVMELELNEWN